MTTSHSEGRRMRGFPLALKLAAAVAVVVALFMTVFGIALLRFLEDTVKEQIMNSAVEAARAAAQADVDAWSPFFGTDDQGLNQAGRQERYDQLTEFERRTYDADEERKAAIKFNQERLKRVVGSDTRILAMDILTLVNGARASLLAKSYEGSLEFSPARGSLPVKFGKGVAQLGLLKVGTEVQPVIRAAYPIERADGSQPAEVSVYIHTQAVDTATGEFTWRVNYAALTFVLLGSAVAFFLGRRITKPLRTLQHDIQAVSQGYLHHHTRAHSSDEIGQLARNFEIMTRNLAQARDAEREAAESQHELSVAAEVTASLIPKSLPEIPGFELAGLHDGTSRLVSEYYDVLTMPDGRFGLLAAGASGSGVPAAMVTGMVRSFLRSEGRRQTDPGDILRQVNALLAPDLRSGMFVTVLLAVLDPAEGTVTVANAGHTPLLWYHDGEKRLGALHSEGIALGFDKGPVFDRTLKVETRRLKPGDRAVLYTTGVQHVLSADESEELGEKRFLGLVKREAGHPANEFVKRMDAALRHFHGGDLVGQDVTLLTVGRLSS